MVRTLFGMPRYFVPLLARQTRRAVRAALAGDRRGLLREAWELSVLAGRAVEARAGRRGGAPNPTGTDRGAVRSEVSNGVADPAEGAAAVVEPRVSVVIATRNRAGSLRACLASLQSSELPAGGAEVVVVDNGSTDDTAAVVASFAGDDSGLPIRYVRENRRGKSYALNAGFAVARGAILAFTDDDVIVDKRWIAGLLGEFRGDPRLAMVAGKVEGVGAGVGNVGVTRGDGKLRLARERSLEGFVLGCNLAVRRDVLERIGGFDTRMGPGRGLTCEDIDLAYRVLRAGFEGWFVPGSIVYHDPSARDRRRENLRGWGAFCLKYLLRGDRHVARLAWWEGCRVLRDTWGGLRGGSWAPLGEAGHLVAGAAIMTVRLGGSLLPRGLRADGAGGGR